MAIMEPLTEIDLKRVNLIERFFWTIRKPGELLEIRGWHDESTGIKGTASGLFSDLRKAAITAIRMSNDTIRQVSVYCSLRRAPE